MPPATPAAITERVAPATFRPKPAPTRSQRPARSRMQFNIDLEVERCLKEIVSYFRSSRRSP